MKAKIPLANKNTIPNRPKSSLKPVQVKETPNTVQNKPVATLKTTTNKIQKRESKQPPVKKSIRNTPIVNPLVAKQELFPCQKCGRTFLQQALKRHSKICEKVFIKKRKQFNSVKQRIISKQQANILKKKKIEKSEPKKQNTTGLPAWKQQSIQLRMAMKKMKGNKLTEEQVFLEKKAKQVSQSNLTKCKFCARSFNTSAAEKHIPICQKKAKDIKQKTTKLVKK